MDPAVNTPVQDKNLYKLGPQFCIDDWLSKHNHTEGKDKEITGINLNIKAVETCTDMQECMMAEKNRHALQAQDYLHALTAYIIYGWPSTRAEVKEEIQLYWPFCDSMAVIDGIVMKGRIAIPASLKLRTL